jgi:hypothetical protein
MTTTSTTLTWTTDSQRGARERWWSEVTGVHQVGARWPMTPTTSKPTRPFRSRIPGVDQQRRCRRECGRQDRRCRGPVSHRALFARVAHVAHLHPGHPHTDVPAHTKVWVVATQPMLRDTGNFVFTLGNTTWNLYGVYFDSPNPSGNPGYEIKSAPLTSAERREALPPLRGPQVLRGSYKLPTSASAGAIAQPSCTSRSPGRAALLPVSSPAIGSRSAAASPSTGSRTL